MHCRAQPDETCEWLEHPWRDCLVVVKPAHGEHQIVAADVDKLVDGAVAVGPEGWRPTLMFVLPAGQDSGADRV